MLPSIWNKIFPVFKTFRLRQFCRNGSCVLLMLFLLAVGYCLLNDQRFSLVRCILLDTCQEFEIQLHEPSGGIEQFSLALSNLSSSLFRSHILKAYSHRELNPAWTYGLIGADAGFFSMLNSALSIFLLAFVHNISCHFIIVNEQADPYAWAFKRFLADPLLQENSRNPLYYWTASNGSMLIKAGPNSTTTLLKFVAEQLQSETLAKSWIDPISDQRSYGIFHPNKKLKNWDLMRQEWVKLEHEMRTQNYFRLKSKLARFFWLLQPAMRNSVEALKETLTVDQQGNAPFIAVHLRRGDKIERGEMKAISITAYVEQFQKLVQENKHIYSSNTGLSVLVLSDDEFSAQTFIANISKLLILRRRNISVTCYTWTQLFQKTYAENKAIFHRIGIRLDSALRVNSRFHSGYHHATRASASDEENRYLMHELISVVSLASNATHFLCTFSSNLSRFVALLRGELQTSHSLDWLWTGF